MKTQNPFAGIIMALLLVSFHAYGQQNRTAKIAVIQTSGLPNQDPFENDFDGDDYE